jgi:hypothetical protein
MALRISSTQNQRVKNLMALQKPRERREQGLFVIEGVREYIDITDEVRECRWQQPAMKMSIVGQVGFLICRIISVLYQSLYLQDLFCSPRS